MKPLSDGSYNNHELDRFLDEMGAQEASSIQFEIGASDTDLFGEPLSFSSASPFPLDEEALAEEVNPFSSNNMPVDEDSDLEMTAASLVSNDQEQAPYAYNDLLSVPSLFGLDDSTMELAQPDTALDDLDLEQPVIEFDDLDLEDLEAEVEAELEDLEAEVEAELEDLEAEVEAELEDLEAEVEAELEDLEAEVEAELEDLDVEVEAGLEDLDVEVEPDSMNLQRLATAFERIDLVQYPETDRRKRESLTPLPMPPDAGNSSRKIPNTSSDFALGDLPHYMDGIDLEKSALDFNTMNLDSSVGDYYEIDLDSLTQDLALVPTYAFPLERDFPGAELPVPVSLAPVQDPKTDLSTTFRLSHPTQGPFISMRQQAQLFSPRNRLLLLVVLALLLAGGTGLLTLHIFSPAQPAVHSTKPAHLAVDAHPAPTSSLNVVVGSVPTVTPTSTPVPTPTPTPKPTIVVTPLIQPTHAFSPPPVAPPAPRPIPTPTPQPQPTPTHASPPAVVNLITNPTFQGFTGWQCSSNAVIANNTLRIIPDSTQGGVCWQTINNLQPNHNYVYQVYLKGSNPGIYVAGWNHWLASSNVANYQALTVTFSTGNATSEAINIYANQGQAEVDAQNASFNLAP